MIDNDDGAKGVLNAVQSKGGAKISLTSKEPFYYLFTNLYLVKTPEIGVGSKSRIEDLFDPELFKTKINGKTFDPDKEHGAANKYSKFVFAEKVIKPKADMIDFSGFAQLLDRIVAAVQDYETRILASAIALS